MKDRIEITYDAIDQIIKCHGEDRPERFGGGTWDAKEEFAIYKKQVGDRYTTLQWSIITSYFEVKFKELKQKVDDEGEEEYYDGDS